MPSSSSSRRRRRAAVVACVATWVTMGVAAPRAQAAPGAHDAVDRFVATVMRERHVPGMGVAIVRAGRIEKLRAYGLANLECKRR